MPDVKQIMVQGMAQVAMEQVGEMASQFEGELDLAAGTPWGCVWASPWEASSCKGSSVSAGKLKPGQSPRQE